MLYERSAISKKPEKTIKEEINTIEKDVNILNISKNDLEKEVNKLILDIETKDKKAKDLTDLIKTSNQNANKKLNKVKEEIEKLKKEKESLKEFEEKINQSNLAKIIGIALNHQIRNIQLHLKSYKSDERLKVLNDFTKVDKKVISMIS
jgi:chromosome segregation ATPase